MRLCERRALWEHQQLVEKLFLLERSFEMVLHS